jgi:putative transposase
VIVTPDTVVRWQRRRFREYWTKLSDRPSGGRPPVNAEIKALVTRLAAANPVLRQNSARGGKWLICWF